MLLAAVTAQAQITIQGSVFGGARQADVGGHTFVNIGADNHDVIKSLAETILPEKSAKDIIINPRRVLFLSK